MTARDEPANTYLIPEEPSRQARRGIQVRRGGGSET